LISRNAEAKPWYLRPKYDPAEVLIDPDGTIRGGTVSALVERLTAHESAGMSATFMDAHEELTRGVDPKFTRAFLMTFKSFMTLGDLFDHLVNRFWIQPPPNLDSQELGEWKHYKQNIIRIR
jgi:son of sevenless-like protein